MILFVEILRVRFLSACKIKACLIHSVSLGIGNNKLKRLKTIMLDFVSIGNNIS